MNDSLVFNLIIVAACEVTWAFPSHSLMWVVRKWSFDTGNKFYIKLCSNFPTYNDSLHDILIHQLSTQQNIYSIIPPGSPWLLLLELSILHALKKIYIAVVKQKPIQDDTPYCYQNDVLPR